MKKKFRDNEDYLVVAEYQVLRLLAENTELFETHTDLFKEYFPHKEARALFLSLEELHKAKEQINETSLLRTANKIESSITLDIIKTLFSQDIQVSSFDNALETLKEGSLKYRVHNKLKRIEEPLENNNPMDMSLISSQLFELQDLIARGGKKLNAKTLDECLDEQIEELKKRKESNYYMFGDYFLDNNLTRKASPGQIILIAASTSMGKSAYALNLLNGMINYNIPCMYFSLEMDTVSTMDRLLSMRTEIPVHEWYVKNNIDSLIPQVRKQKEELIGKPFRLIDDPSISLDKIRSTIRDFKIMYKTNYVCVYIDLITQVKEFIDIHGARQSLATSIEIACNRLNEMAKNENVCFVCVAQMNREADNFKINSVNDVEKLRPSLTTIKNSNALAERSRVVISMFRAKTYIERYLPDTPDLELIDDIADVSIIKQNQGVLKVGKYVFDGPCFAMRPLVDENKNLIEDTNE